jgi:hypothetical protein
VPDGRPDRVFWVGRLKGQVEADEFLVVFDELECLGASANLLGDAVEFIVEHVAKPLGEDERKNEVLELWSVFGAANGASGVPDPGFQRFIRAVHCHLCFVRSEDLTIPKMASTRQAHEAIGLPAPELVGTVGPRN